MKSLERLLGVGAALWTVGLLAATTILLTHSRTAFNTVAKFHEHLRISTVIALVSLVAGFTVVRVAMGPLERLRRRLSDVRAGTARQVDGDYPSEVQPLVEDLNALLEHADIAVARAHAKAGDLAHGLKTPLAVLSNEASELAATGHTDAAQRIGQQVLAMQRQVEYHLAHARAAASGKAPGGRCSVRESADALMRTLSRLHSDKGLRLEAHVPAGDLVRVRREDLDEMLGNLLDNACKWARGRVVLTSRSDGPLVVITVEDDGPGIDPTMRGAVLRRGVRADEAAPGSGLGLAIVGDLAGLYGGSIALGESPLGGLSASLSLPSPA